MQFLPLAITFQLMKQLLSFILSFFFLSVFAQQQEEHLNFMGRPIAGSSEYFISFLEEKGFVKIDEFESSYSFVGKFANEIVYVSFFKDFGGHITLEDCPKKCNKVTYEDDSNMKVAQSELESKAFDDLIWGVAAPPYHN